ncbi:hypothetical protein Tco_1359820 [Tanacetum coccineum]
MLLFRCRPIFGGVTIYMILWRSSVADALAEYEANRSRGNGDSHDSGSGGRRLVPTTCKCMYSDFLKCQPLNIKGTEGVNAMENIDEEDDQQELALMCGRMFPEESDQVEKYVGGLPDRQNVARAYSAGPSEKKENAYLCATSAGFTTMPHGRMILESVENGPLIWPTIEENGVTRPKKYTELSATKQIKADSDLIVPVFQKGNDPIDVINHMMSFLTAIVTSRYPTTNNQLRNSSNLRQQATINDKIVTLQPIQGRQTSFVADCSPEKAQQLELKLYDGNDIKNTTAIVIPDSEETIMLAEESHSKILLKQQDPMMLKKKNSVNSPEPTLSNRPTKVEVPKELPKVSMVNTSLKKLKHHLAGFDVVVKERTTTITILRARRDIVNIILNSYVDNTSVNVHECEKCLKLETELLNKSDFIEKEIFDKLFKSFTTLEKHCISLEVNNQLNQEVFQRDNSISNQSAPSFDQYFELNELKAQSQVKDTVIKKLKERIKSLSGKMNKDKIKKDLEEIETINIELDHKVSNLIAENEHLKQTYKQLYDSIKPARTRSKEQCDALNNQVNLKSVEISDLNASLQEKVLVITALKDDLRKLKGKALVDNAVMKHTINPEMLKIDVEPITPKLLNKRTAHSAYIKHAQEEAAVLRNLVEHVKANYPLDHSLESAFSGCDPKEQGQKS